MVVHAGYSPFICTFSLKSNYVAQGAVNGTNRMNIIEKIELKHFRSFDGGKGQARASIEDLKDLNVFSGANDSGKSNILRALNLFFNDEISPGVKFDKNRDFSKIASTRFDKEIKQKRDQEKIRFEKSSAEGSGASQRDLRRSDEVISIKLFFNNFEKQRGLPEKFWISKSYSQKNRFEGGNNYPKVLQGNAQVSLFLSSFQFEYVPAIKDRAYFNYLFQKLQTYLFEKEGKNKKNQFGVASENFNKVLKKETKQLFDKFRKSSGVEASFHIPSTLVDFFRTLSVNTENDIALSERGDGVQARFIPEILEEMSINSKKNIVWGFEEPENSYEARNIRKLRDDFLKKYSRSKQIFITTHTKEFLSVERNWTVNELAIKNDSKLSLTAKKAKLRKLEMEQASSAISIYRIWKNESAKDSSSITRFDEENGAWEDTCDDLGIIQEARIVETLQDTISSQTKEIEELNLSDTGKKSIINELQKTLHEAVKNTEEYKELIEEHTRPILYVEDKCDAIYKIAFLKIHHIKASASDYDDIFKLHAPFVIHRGEGAGGVAGKLSTKNTDGYKGRKLIGLFDFDCEGTKCFYHLKNQNNWDENISGDRAIGYYKKRNQHDCFYALLIPVPERLHDVIADVTQGIFTSFVEIEQLLPNDFLTTNKLVKDKSITGSLTYLKIRNSMKSKLMRILIEAPADTFDDFIPLFDKICKLFDIPSKPL